MSELAFIPIFAGSVILAQADFRYTAETRDYGLNAVLRRNAHLSEGNILGTKDGFADLADNVGFRTSYSIGLLKCWISIRD